MDVSLHACDSPEPHIFRVTRHRLSSSPALLTTALTRCCQAATQSGQLAVSTAALKKRRIAQSVPHEAIDNPNQAALFAPEVHDPDRQPSPSSSSPRQSPTPSSFQRSSPARYLPPHLHEEVAEGRSRSESADSPSEAYAALNLDSSVRSESMSGSQDGDAEQHASVGQRSASPAKRPASHMESAEGGSVAEDAGQRMVQDSQGSQGTLSQDTLMEDEGPPAYSEQDGQAVNGTGSAPSLDEQVEQVTQIALQQLEEGQKGFIVSTKWLARVRARTTEGQQSRDFEKVATEGEIGPVDNVDVAAPGAFEGNHARFEGTEIPFIPLKAGLIIESEYIIIPEKAWALIMSWYGLAQGQLPIVRFVRNTTPDGPSSNLQYEVYPPLFVIRRVLSKSGRGATPPTPPRTTTSQATTGNTTPDRDTEPAAVQVVATRYERFQSFLARCKRLSGIEMPHKVRIWRQLGRDSVATDKPKTEQAGILTPAASRDASPVNAAATAPVAQKLIVEQADFAKWEEGTDYEMVDAQDRTADEKYNGKASLELLGLAESQTIVLEEQLRGPAGGEYASDSRRKKKTEKPKANGQSGRTSPAPSGPITRGRSRKDGRTRGAIGLTNLGNTCYMNSALQCISRVEELAVYFLQNKYKSEINTDNPLGYNGKMAKAYAGVLEGLYADNASSAFRPSNFKSMLGMSQPLFSGYGQQDSQEFLSFLVDALHEDLNRIHKKPYIENPDSDDATVKDPEAIKALGEKFRANHRARNDSIAMDLFSGFYKNTMVCPDCERVSITFDPYSLLTLQLPIENTWQHTVFLVPFGKPPVAYEVDLDKNAPIRAIKDFIASRVPGLTTDRLFFAESFSRKIYKAFPDKESINDQSFRPGDLLFVFELPEAPTNVNYERKRQGYRSILSKNEDPLPDMDSPFADRMVVPILHRRLGAGNYNSNSFDLNPTFILITKEEAKDYDAILRKVLASVSTITSRKFLEENPDKVQEVQSSSEDGVAPGNDSTPDVDAKLSDRSVESEDGYVDVSLQNDASSGGTAPSQTSVLQPGSFIHPSLRNMFEMKYVQGEGMHCEGNFSQVKPMQDRVQAPAGRRSSVSSVQSSASRTSQDSGFSGRGQTTSESDVDEETPDIVLGESNNQPSNPDMQSEDDDLPPIESLTQKNLGRKKFNQKRRGKQMTYSKKGGRRGSKQSVRSNLSRESTKQSTPEPNAEANPYYIKLGEGIVLDWRDDAFVGLFGGDPADKDDLRGHSLINEKTIPIAEDAALQAKKQKRALRRKNGITLDECFAETGKTEILSEENAWYCSRCKELRRASKTLEIWTAPDILVIHLKRFSGERHRRDKIDVTVDFPLEGLDLTDRVGLKEDGKECVYDLFAVDNHYGGLGGGHYTAYAKNFYDGKWYDFNDSFVSQQNPSSIISPAAYLLFYRRRSPTPLGPPYLRDLVAKARAPSSALSDDEDADPESGEERRSGSSRPPGSSTAGTGAAVSARGEARGLRGGGGLGASRGAGTRMSDEDEGIGLGSDDDAEAVGGKGGFEMGGGWGFDALDEGADDGDGMRDEVASTVPADGSLGGSDAAERMRDLSDDDEVGFEDRGRNTPLFDEDPDELGLGHAVREIQHSDEE